MPSSNRLRPILTFASVGLAFVCSCRASFRAGAHVSSEGATAGQTTVVPLPSVLGGSTKLADSADADTQAAASGAKMAEWTTTFVSADCTSQNVTVIIRPDGTGNLESLSQITGARSASWSWAVAGLDSTARPIWSLPYHRGPRMDGSKGGATSANDFGFNYDSTKFERTAQIRLIGVC